MGAAPNADGKPGATTYGAEFAAAAQDFASTGTEGNSTHDLLWHDPTEFAEFTPKPCNLPSCFQRSLAPWQVDGG